MWKQKTMIWVSTNRSIRQRKRPTQHNANPLVSKKKKKKAHSQQSTSFKI